jgi:beta-lactamase class C
MGLLACSAPLDAKDLSEQQVKAVIDQQFKPLLAQYNIPGLQLA